MSAETYLGSAGVWVSLIDGHTVNPIDEWPDATTTGVPDGVTLTPSGPVTTSADGEVIDALDITGTVIIGHDDVTLKQCRITVDQLNFAAISGSGANAVVQDCEIIGGAGTQGSYNGVQLAGSGAQILRCNIHNFENGVSFTGNSQTLQDSYIHDLYATYAGATPHYDGTECGAGSGFAVHHNRILNAQGQTSAVNFTGDFGNIDTVTITNNYLSGGTYTIYLDPKTNTITQVTLDYNTLLHDAVYGPLASGASYAHAPTGNVYTDGSPAF